MSLIIKNLADGSSQTVASGGVGFLTLQATALPAGSSNAAAPRGIHVEWDSSEYQYSQVTTGMVVVIDKWGSIATETGVASGAGAGSSGAGSLTVTGDLVASSIYSPIQQNDPPPPGTDGQYLHATPAGFITLNLTTPGLFYITLELQGLKGTEYCGLVVTVLPAYNLPMYPALTWPLPSNVIDLQVDVNARTANSNILSHALGLKQGDDFTIAVVPQRAGTLETSGITEMSFTIIDRADSPYAPLAFTATGSPPSLTEIGGNPAQQYYTITGNLRDPSIAQWFADLNARVAAIIAANGATGATQQAVPDPTRLEALAQLHLTDASGITTTQNFPLPILAEPEVLTAIGAATTAADSAMDLVWDLGTNNVTDTDAPASSPSTGSGPSAPPAPLLYLKEEDDLIVRLRLVKNASALAPSVTGCKLVLKELEPDNQIVISDGFATAGSGDNFSVLLHAQFSGALLAASLSNYESDTGTTFSALAELELTYTNPWTGTVGPSTLTRTSKTFRIQIDRDLGEAA